MSRGKSRRAEKDETIVVASNALTTDGQTAFGYNPELAEHFVHELLANEEARRLNELGMAMLADLENYHLNPTVIEKFRAELKDNPTPENLERLKDKVLTSGVILDFEKMFRGSLAEFQKAVDEITDPRLRYRIAHYSREMAAYGRILGNIARRNALEERRDQINGAKSKINRSPKTAKLQAEIDEKVKAILCVDRGAEWNVVWQKVWIDQNVRKLAKSRNTIEKYARMAYCRNNLLTPLVDEKLR